MESAHTLPRSGATSAAVPTGGLHRVESVGLGTHRRHQSQVGLGHQLSAKPSPMILCPFFTWMTASSTPAAARSAVARSPGDAGRQVGTERALGDARQFRAPQQGRCASGKRFPGREAQPVHLRPRASRTSSTAGGETALGCLGAVGEISDGDRRPRSGPEVLPGSPPPARGSRAPAPASTACSTSGAARASTRARQSSSSISKSRSSKACRARRGRCHRGGRCACVRRPQLWGEAGCPRRPTASRWHGPTRRRAGPASSAASNASRTAARSSGTTSRD